MKPGPAATDSGLRRLDWERHERIGTREAVGFGAAHAALRILGEANPPRD